MGKYGKSRRNGQRRRHNDNNDEPFIYLTIKVGVIILCVGYVITQIILVFWSDVSLHHTTNIRRQSMDVKYHDTTIESKRERTTLPFFNLNSKRLQSDAFGMHDKFAKDNNNYKQHHEFYNEIYRLKKQFTSIYGGENAARYLIHSGVTTFPASDNNISANNFDIHNIPSGMKHTANRILSARQQNRSFKIAFGGYSVTVGRGNYFNQSYPFVLERLLSKPMEKLGIKLDVRNAAIGGVPSFPYGWCFDSFLGDDVDVISWDYSMNEAGGVADGLEAYIRQGLSMKRQPMLIVKDTSTSIAQERYDLLQQYVDKGFLKDPIELSMEDTINTFLNVKDDYMPAGFREWKKFGALPGAPGQSSHHPGVKEHELYGWLLTMHFVAVLELVAYFISHESDKLMKGLLIDEQKLLPEPTHGRNIIPLDAFSLFYGQPTSDQMSSPWKMNQIHCRTSFDPILKNNLRDIIVSGVTAEDVDIMLPKGAQLYNKGWVLDLGDGEKKAKKKLERYGNLGYIDSKKAFYGIKASGPLEMFLPCIDSDDIEIQSLSVFATECFKNIVVCEVNDKHTKGTECNLNNDLSFVVGGMTSQDVKPVNATGAFYWGRNICIRVGIPSESLLSKSKGLVGLSFAISVATTSVMIRSGPCSISHVIWEQSNK